MVRLESERLIVRDYEGSHSSHWARAPFKAPILSFPCFTHHARLSSQNGIALRLWLSGTNRSVGVADDLPKELDQLLAPYLEMTSDDHSYVFGDFEICPN
jgi:hypothetical protein